MGLTPTPNVTCTYDVQGTYYIGLARLNEVKVMESEDMGRCQITFMKSIQVIADVRRVPGGFLFRGDNDNDWSFVSSSPYTLVKPVFKQIQRG